MKDKGNSKRKATITLLFFLMIVLTAVFTVRPTKCPVSCEILAVREEIAKTGRIVHAGGFLQTKEKTVRYTNSYDALVNMYEQGNRVCEIDIRETIDGALICAHGDETVLADGTGLPVDATEKDFLSVRLFESFQPMTVQMLTQFMHQHEDLLIITDIRGDNVEICRKLAQNYPELRQRFLIQIYHKEEYEPVNKMGFPYIIYTLYREEDSERNLWKLAHFVQRHELVGVTIQYDQFYSRKNQIAMNHCGVPFMFHTVDDASEITAMLRKPYVLGVYTDFTLIDS